METTFVFAVIGVVIFLYFLFVKWRHQYWARKGVPQLKPNIIFGNYLPLLIGKKSMKDFFLELYQQFKPTGVKYLGTYNTIFPEFIPLDIDLIKRILTKDFIFFGSHGAFHHKNDPFSMNLFTLDGAEWKERRVKLTPVFTTGKMKMMFDTVAAKTIELTKIVNKHIEANESFDIKETLARFGTDVIGSVAFGLDCDTLNEPEHKFRAIGRKTMKPNVPRFFMELLFSREILGRLGYHQVTSDIETYFTNVVKETIYYREKNNVQRKDFIQLMLQLKNNGAITSGDGLTNNKKGTNWVSEQEIINEAFLFFLGGFETSSSTMTFTFFELAQHLDIQEKARKEILEVLERYNGNITYDGIMEMEYLDKIIKETLRKYPVVPALPRECTRNYQIPGTDIIIEKGTKVQIPVIGLHLDPEFYPNPEEFNPENFSSEKKAQRPDCAWIPFGEGPRQCIGLRFGVMQSKVGIVALLKDFSFILDEKLKLPFTADGGSLIYCFKEDVLIKASRI